MTTFAAAASLVAYSAAGSSPEETDRDAASREARIRPATPDDVQPAPSVPGAVAAATLRAVRTAPAPETAPSPDVTPTAAEPAPAPEPQRTVWDDLADCESGDWVDGVPQPGTARWDYGLTFSHGDIYEGGLNFHPGTWDQYRDPAMPGHAGQATRAQQIAVAERVLADQGWGAWPVCSRKIGVR